jgi:carboxymethylenebutenolidase
VVLLSGMFGLNWRQRQITCTLARAGFVALSPDLLDGQLPQDLASALLAKNSLDLERAVEETGAGAEYLRKLPWVGTEGKVAVLGFCLGGGLALLALARTRAFQAGVIYHHSVFPDPRELQQIQCKLLCHYGTEDKTTPREEVEAFREALEQYGKQYEILWYEGMGHSFLNNPPAGGSPQRERAASESLEKTFAFLRRELCQ